MLTVRDSGLGILGLGTWDWGLSRDRGSGIGDRGSGLVSPGIRRRDVESFPVCYPLTELSVVRHEPHNRFLESALAATAEFIVTVNTAPGHFDRKQYQAVSVMRPGDFLNLPDVGRLVKKLLRG
jgi:hypothetical protein